MESIVRPKSVMRRKVKFRQLVQSYSSSDDQLTSSFTPTNRSSPLLLFPPSHYTCKQSLARLTLSRGSSFPPAGGPEDLSPAADEMNNTQHHHHPSGLTVPLPVLSSTGGMSTVESTKAMVRKRITTWEYLRKAHEGRVYWFNVRLFFEGMSLLEMVYIAEKNGN